jgi:hypothetical protein
LQASGGLDAQEAKGGLHNTEASDDSHWKVFLTSTLQDEANGGLGDHRVTGHGIDDTLGPASEEEHLVRDGLAEIARVMEGTG